MKRQKRVDNSEPYSQPAKSTKGRRVVKLPGDEKVIFSDGESYSMNEAMTAYQFVAALLKHRRGLFDDMWAVFQSSPALPEPPPSAKLKEADVLDKSGLLKPVYHSVLACGVVELDPGVFDMLPPCRLDSEDFARWLAAEDRYRASFVQKYSFLKQDGGPPR